MAACGTQRAYRNALYWLLEARAIYSTGNKARDNIGRNINYYEPLNLDTGYYAGWSRSGRTRVPGFAGLGRG